MTNTLSLQAATDKTTEDVHQTILETDQLTQGWEDVVKQMQQQDTEAQASAVVTKHATRPRAPPVTDPPPSSLHPETGPTQADHQGEELHPRRDQGPAGHPVQEQPGDGGQAEPEQAEGVPAAAGSEGAGEEPRQAEGRGQTPPTFRGRRELRGRGSALSRRRRA